MNPCGADFLWGFSQLIDSLVENLGMRRVCPYRSCYVSGIRTNVGRDAQTRGLIDIAIYDDNTVQLAPLPEVVITFHRDGNGPLRALPSHTAAILCAANRNELGVGSSGDR